MKKFYSLLAGAFAFAALAQPQPGRAYELEGGNIYGYVLQSSSYYNMPASKFYSFAADNPADGKAVGTTGYLNPQPSQAGTFVGGTFYTIGGSYGTSYAITVENNGTEWTVTDSKTVSGLNITTDLTDDDGTIYGWCQFTGEAGQWYLGTYDFAAGTVTKIGSATTTRLIALTSDGNGSLYGISSSGDLYSVSKADGALTLVGNTGYSANDSYQSACYDSAKGTILWARYYKDPSGGYWATAESSFIDVDPTTGNGTLRSQINNAPQIIGLCAPASFDPSAPGEVTDFTATNDGTDNVINITFTMPTKNFAGQDFNPNLRGLSYTVLLDGEKVCDAVPADKGETVTVKLETTSGTHNLAVYVSQTVFGDGPEVKASLYVGEDTPGAVKNLEASANGDVVSLTWNVPDAVHGGVYDAEKLSYNIRRGGVEVATDVKENSFTEIINSDALVGYSYTVTTVYNGEVTEYSATSATVFVGPAYKVTPATPYAPDFSGCATGDDSGWILVCDPSSYGNPDPTLSIETTETCSFLKVNVSSYYANPKLFTTALELESGHTYRLAFDFITDNFYGATFSVQLSDSPTSDCTNIKQLVASTSYGMYAANTLCPVGPVEFTVDNSGVYFVSMQNYMFNANWGFANFKLEDLTVTGVDNIADNTAVSISAAAGRLTVAGAKDLPVTVSTLAGVPVYTGVVADDVLELELNPGIYVVRAGDKAVKINL